MIHEPPDKPSTLCHFRTFAAEWRGGRNETDVYDLLYGRLRFTSVDKFNDPFEARPQLVAAFADPIKQKWAMHQYLEGVARRAGAPDPKAWAVTRIAGKSTQEVLDEFSEMLGREHLRSDLRLLCLSEGVAVTKPLLWSHYADSHRGVCIHFDPTLAPLRFSYPVKYCVEYPKLVLPRTHQQDWDAVQNQLLSKCDDWKYEREWRVIRSRLQPGGFADTLMTEWDGDIAIARGEIVKAITLGARMSEQVRSRLKAWVRTNVPHVEVWQARLHRSRFEVERERE